MKLIDATELLKNEAPAKAFSPEMLVVGKGHILAAWEATNSGNAVMESLAELHAAMIRYEGDVDGESPSEHRRMMDRVATILQANAERAPRREPSLKNQLRHSTAEGASC